MKFYSFKTNYNCSNYFDYREWKKHINNLEKKVDALWNYLNLSKPNYSIVNWNQYNLITDNSLMLIDRSSPYSKGSIYNHNSKDYYFIKCFNNNDILWLKNNMILIDDFPNEEILNQIDTGSFKTFINLKDRENSWLLIDKNDDKGYKFLPSSTGYGGLYTIQWRCNNKDKKYFLYFELNNNGKDVIEYFFNNPLQVRWNKFSNNLSINDQYSIITFNEDILGGKEEFYQGQKQLMHKIYRNTSGTYEPVMADYKHKENTIQKRQELTWVARNDINLEVYYW